MNRLHGRTLLLTGGNGNLARQLSLALLSEGAKLVLVDQAASIVAPPVGATCVQADITSRPTLHRLFSEHRPTHVLHFASLLSSTSEADRDLAWRVNMDASFELFECCLRYGAEGFFLPSTGATYGGVLPDPLPEDWPQWPENLYGVTKVATERLGHYYQKKHGLDFRSLRLPMVISRYAPKGAVSAYASHAFVAAAAGEDFVFPVPPSVAVSTVYIKDVIAGITELLLAPKSKLSRSIYNVHGFSPTAEDFARAIRDRVPGFRYSFEVQPQLAALVSTWPGTHEDACSRRDWGWAPKFDLPRAADDLLQELSMPPRSGA